MSWTMARNWFFVLVILAVIAGATFALVIVMTPVDTSTVCEPVLNLTERYYREGCICICQFDFDTWSRIDRGLLG